MNEHEFYHCRDKLFGNLIYALDTDVWVFHCDSDREWINIGSRSDHWRWVGRAAVDKTGRLIVLMLTGTEGPSE